MGHCRTKNCGRGQCAPMMVRERSMPRMPCHVPWASVAIAIAASACAPPALRSGGAVPARSPAAELPVAVADGVVADRARGEVSVRAEVACNQGWLEQAVCARGTRDHESLIVIGAAASSVHAAMLLVGLEPGVPGSWRESPGAPGGIERVLPHGPAVELWVRLDGREVPLSSWVADPARGRRFDAHPWVFTGSRMRVRRDGAGQDYAADRSGSIVGIVTFGDEVIAFREVVPDRTDVSEPQWQARTDAMPTPGTAVELVIRVPRGGSA